MTVTQFLGILVLASCIYGVIFVSADNWREAVKVCLGMTVLASGITLGIWLILS